MSEKVDTTAGIMLLMDDMKKSKSYPKGKTFDMSKIWLFKSVEEIVKNDEGFGKCLSGKGVLQAWKDFAVDGEFLSQHSLRKIEWAFVKECLLWNEKLMEEAITNQVCIVVVICFISLFTYKFADQFWQTCEACKCLAASLSVVVCK